MSDVLKYKTQRLILISNMKEIIRLDISNYEKTEVYVLLKNRRRYCIDMFQEVVKQEEINPSIEHFIHFLNKSKNQIKECLKLL